jgi:hypothetical protein
VRLFANLQSYPSPALFQVILSAMSFPSVDIDRRLFVSKGGNDSNKGSPNAPFLTIGAAIASIDTWAIAPSAADPVLVVIGPGEFTESSFGLAPFVNLGGAGSNLTVLEIPSQTISFGGYYGSNNISALAIKGGYIDRSADTLDLFSLTFYSCFLDTSINGASSENVVISFIACNGLKRDNPSEAADLSLNVGHFRMIGCSGYKVFVGSIYNPSGYDSTISIIGSQVTVLLLQGSSNNSSATARVIGSDIVSGQVNHSGGTGIMTLETDASYDPSVWSGDALDVLTFVDKAEAQLYAPATPGDWAGPAPVSVAAALDRLAAATPGA